jgi:hypothetical protein
MLTQSTQLRQQRKVDLEQHVSEVNRLVQQANGVLPGVDYNADSSDDDSADEFQGFDQNQSTTKPNTLTKINTPP